MLAMINRVPEVGCDVLMTLTVSPAKCSGGLGSFSLLSVPTLEILLG